MNIYNPAQLNIPAQFVISAQLDISAQYVIPAKAGISWSKPVK